MNMTDWNALNQSIAGGINSFKTARDNKEVDELKKKAIIQELNDKIAAATGKKAEQAKANSMSTLGDKAISDYLEGTSAQGEMDKASAYKATGKDWLTDPNYNPNEMAGGQVLSEQGYNPNLGQKRLKLAQYAPYNEGAKGVLNEGKTAANNTVFGYKEKYDNPENRANNEESINSLLRKGKIDEADANILKNANQGVGVYEVMNRLSSMSANVTTRVRNEKETQPIRIQTAGGTAAASTGARINKESELSDITSETEGKVSESRSAASERGRIQERYAQAAKGNYDVSMAEGVSIANAIQAIDAMEKVANAIEAGGFGLADVTPLGVFTNPAFKMDNEVIEEYYARPISGAAINAGEWRKFKSELGTGFFNMATEKGRAAAANRLRGLILTNKQAGALALKDDGWYDRVSSYGRDEKDDTTVGTVNPKQSELRKKYNY